MANESIRFYLHNKANAEGRQPINMEVRWAKHVAAPAGTTPAVRLSTGKVCHPKHWKNEQATSKEPGSTGINDRLAAMRKAAGKLLDKAANEETTVTPDQMKAELLAVTQRKPAAPAGAAKKPKAVTIAGVAAEYEAYHTPRRGEFALRKYKSFVASWEAYRPGTLLADLLPDEDGQTEIVEGWLAYLSNEHVLPNGQIGMSDNSVGSHISRLKQLLKFRGLRTDWLTNDYSYEPDIEPLLFEEVLQLAQQWLPDPYPPIRDCFVFNCLTGPRYANLSRLAREAVRQDSNGTWIMEYAPVKASRNTKNVRVALDPLAVEIWQRYEGQLPVPANQTMNDYIKEAGRLAGLNRSVLKVVRKNRISHEVRGPLWQFLTCHVARHTFGTLLLDGGAALTDAQDGLGHVNIQNTRRYAKTRDARRHGTTLTAFSNLRGTSTAESGSHTSPEDSHTQPESVRETAAVPGTLRQAKRIKPAT
ncbi:tyrosine-type recombinase/integrase [Hymenobacter properus]|uniref:Tyrosine-type recombinase/integrase n=1 Tax=Hymenobacter properus TaxID=2791026 RepID=A0A931FLL5_9BACT|nr:tyrosine-type recombinase/integrase [Hymenobacter properus]MBF9140804.1 tyrosine-type recombinase/integrase [Hymenobacter properus]MBR7719613.1 tyrosine-type recombinase/integrase [Microvirga sp. SRT04]